MARRTVFRNRAGCRLRRSPGLAALLSPVSPGRRTTFPRPPALRGIRRSGQHAIRLRLYSRAAATASLVSATAERLPVFPSAKSAVSGRGQIRSGSAGAERPLWSSFLPRPPFSGSRAIEVAESTRSVPTYSSKYPLPKLRYRFFSAKKKVNFKKLERHSFNCRTECSLAAGPNRPSPR